MWASYHVPRVDDAYLKQFLPSEGCKLTEITSCLTRARALNRVQRVVERVLSFHHLFAGKSKWKIRVGNKRKLAHLLATAQWLCRTIWGQPMIECLVTTVRLHGCYLADWVTLSSGVIYTRPKLSARALLHITVKEWKHSHTTIARSKSESNTKLHE